MLAPTSKIIGSGRSTSFRTISNGVRVTTSSYRGRVPRDGGALHQALVARAVVGRGAVQQAAVVPDHQVADAPVERQAEARLDDEVVELAQQRAALLDRPADDVRGMRAGVDRLAAIDR